LKTSKSLHFFNLLCSQIVCHPQQDLAKFGYKPSVKVKEINNSILFQLFLELVIEIWLLFIYLLEIWQIKACDKNTSGSSCLH
jgi:hypothetical protein